MRRPTNEHRGDIIFACATVLIIAAVMVEAHFSTAQAMWLASKNVPASVIVIFMIGGPWLLGIGLFAVLANWPDIRWYLWRQRKFRHAVEQARERERDLFLAGATDSAVLATILPRLSECMFEVNRSVLGGSSSREYLAYQAVVETYLERLKVVAERETEDTSSRVASLQAQLRHHRSFLSSFE